MKRIYKFLIILLVLSFVHPQLWANIHFLKDKTYREKVHKQFLKRKEIAKSQEAELFSVFEDESLTLQEREALEFLFAYMPVSDLADYDGNFFLQQVRGAFKTLDTFEWGKNIPDDVFRHFVLVYRVNNENLDNAREVFFEELKDRVKSMTMEEAALEVNHWCHEKVTYSGTDIRTSAPLALMKTSWGRCGEESTFTVAALRSVGIPARQCYTPRWVHSDDNHAWVEVWIDGKWRYLGACEPKPKLDEGWFSAPATRAMLVHTTVFGDYDGPEDKISSTELCSVINVLNNYADTRVLTVEIIDANNQPIENAKVYFEVYNYAEFYPIASIDTDKNGLASLRINREGDIHIAVSKDGKYAHQKINSDQLKATIKLETNKLPKHENTFVMRVPSEKHVDESSDEELVQNNIRLAKEDSIRNSYMSSFIQEEKARQFAQNINLSSDSVWNLLNKSRGNWIEIYQFIEDNQKNPFTLSFLYALKDKDLRDTPKSYLEDHLTNGTKFAQKNVDSLSVKYMLSPRISNELIRPWRSFLQKQLKENDIKNFQSDPELLVNYVKDNIHLTTENYYKCPISPQGVYELKLADSHSRNIFFVALARSIGVLSRLNPITQLPQYYKNGDWVDVIFEDKSESPKAKGSIIFENNTKNKIDPQYYLQYTIAMYDGNNFKTLNLEDEIKHLPEKVMIDEGQYRMMVGNRAKNGDVYITAKNFTVSPDEQLIQQVTLPDTDDKRHVFGTISVSEKVELDTENIKSVEELINGKGLVLIFADPDKEPTKHILQDLPAVSKSLNEWGGTVLFLVPDDKHSAAFNPSKYENLPEKTIWGTDRNRNLLNQVVASLGITFSNNFPLVLYLSKSGDILYHHQGYIIGIGDNILKTIELDKQ